MSTPFLYLVYGEETFLAEEYVARIRGQFPGYQETVLKDQVSTETIQMNVMGIDLFCPAKFLLIKDLAVLSATAAVEDVGSWVDTFRMAAQGPNVVVIWMQTKRPDMRKKLCSELKKIAQVQECVSFKDWEQDKVMQWVSGRFRSIGKTISHDALVAIEQAGGVNLRHLSGMVDMLSVYVGERDTVAIQDVLAVSGGGQASVYLLTEAFRERKSPQVMLMLSRLLESGEEPIRLLGLFVATIRLYYQLLVLDARRTSTQQMGQILGKSPYFLQRLLVSVKRHYKTEDMVRAFGVFAALDLAIKTGKVKPKIGLEQAVFSVLG
jgi:DNA polymerase-3 subunit delta